MFKPQTSQMRDLIRSLTDRGTPKRAKQKAFLVLRKALTAEDAAESLEQIMFECSRLSLAAKRAVVHLLFRTGNDDAFNVLVRVVDDASMPDELKNQAAKSLLHLNPNKAWKRLGLSGPKWFKPITLVGATMRDPKNGPGKIGGLADRLFKDVADSDWQPEPATDEADGKEDARVA
jgi:hypothetical protein